MKGNFWNLDLDLVLLLTTLPEPIRSLNRIAKGKKMVDSGSLFGISTIETTILNFVKYQPVVVTNIQEYYNIASKEAIN